MDDLAAVTVPFSRRMRRIVATGCVAFAAAAAALVGGDFSPEALHAQTTATPAAPDALRVVHNWRRVFYGRLDGQESLLFAGSFERAKPAMGDLDGDGDLDMIVGTADGRLMYFENQGNAKQPRFRLVNETLTTQPQGASPAGDDQNLVIAVGANAAPALTDIDGDGDLDMFVGSASGKIFFFRNVGNKFLAVFRLESADVLGVSFGLNTVPKLADVKCAERSLRLGWGGSGSSPSSRKMSAKSFRCPSSCRACRT
jgi:hypothetical protein